MHSSSQKITYIMKAMDVGNQLSSVPDELQSQFATNPFGLTTAQNERMINHFGRAFMADSLTANARSVFAEDFDNEYADSTISWLNRESVQKVLQAERATSTLQGQREQIVRMYEIEQNPPTDERLELIDRLTQATLVTETTINSYSIIFRSFVSGFSVLSDQQNFTESQIDNFVTNYRMQIQPQVQQETINRFLITYYELDDEILREYLSFIQTDAGQWLSTTAAKSIQTALQSASDRFIESLDSTETE